MARKVLLIEDEPFVQEMVRDTLIEAGIEVEVCSNSADAVRLFSLSVPDLVIVDMGLPDGNGLALCKILGLGATVDTPFVFLSGRDDLKTRLAAFEAGAHDYIVKPFSFEELLARVKVQFHIKQLHDDLSRKNYDLEMINRTRQDVMSMIVHDLKTPLASIMGTLEIVKAREARNIMAEGNPGKLIESAGVAANFMLLMVNDLLDIGRADTVGLKTESAPLSLETLFDNVKRLFSHRLERAGKSLSIRIAPEIVEITSDHVLLFRILVNLIANAVKISERGSAVEVEVSADGGGFRFAVLDRGPGIPATMKKAIFEKYSTTQPKSLSEDGGTGIGLTFCRVAVQALGGSIWAEDRPGGGTAFIVRLPGVAAASGSSAPLSR